MTGYIDGHYFKNNINLQTFLLFLRNSSLRYKAFITLWVFIYKTKECENCGKEIIQRKIEVEIN